MASLTSNRNNNSADPQSVIAKRATGNVAATTAHQFPADLPGHYAKITFVKYDRANPNSSPTDSITGNIVLPVPSQLMDTSTFQYLGNEAGILGNIPGMGQNPGWKQSFADVSKSVGALNETLSKDGFLSAAEQLLSAVPGSQDFQVGRLVGAQTGKILNPHLSTIFQGVALRTHTFTWRLSPRNVEETKAITAIDTLIKLRIHPKMSGNGFSLNYPDQLYMSFFPESADFTYKVRKSSVLAYTLNDAATGLPAWFGKTNAPTDYELTLSLQEVDIVTRDELGG